MKEVMRKIGEYGPLILFLINVFLLRNTLTYQIYYIVVVFLSLLLNFVLKLMVKQKRPSIDEKTFELMVKNGKRYIEKNGQPYDIYGMPSGHSQSVILSTVFNYIVFQDIRMTCGFGVVSLITMSQRILDNHHTGFQVVVGGAIGGLLGYGGYSLAKKAIVGKLRKKAEDNAPI